MTQFRVPAFQAPSGRLPLPTRLPALLLAAALCATTSCDRQPAPAQSAQAIATSSSGDDTIARLGDVTMHASVMQTSSLDEGVAKDYGIARSDQTILLLVAVRKGADAVDSALPATITATATDQDGVPHPLRMRELRTGSLVDYVGSVDIKLPGSLAFDVHVVRENGERSRMQFKREFFPR